MTPAGPALLPLLAAAAGLAAAALQWAGALKTTPVLAWLPADATLLAAGLLFLLLPPLLAAGGWRISPSVLPPLLAAAALWLWWCLAALWSPAGPAAEAKLLALLGAGPAMLLAGLAVGGDGRARAGLAFGVLVVGSAVGAGTAWGIATDGVVLGGRLGEDPTRIRVAYQLAGLAIATAGGVAALRLAMARGPARLFWLLLLLALAAAVVLPGGRAALLAMGAVVFAVPVLFWLLGGRPWPALLWGGLVLALGLAAAASLASDATWAAGLRSLERLLTPPGGGEEERWQLWADALRLSGILGIGPGAFPVAAGFGDHRGMHPHNHGLEALVEGGVPGLALWLAAFGGGLLLLLLRARRLGPERAALLLALVLPQAITVMVSTDLGNRMAWFALGLALSAGVERARV
ncbi:MAG: O-antigen ligase family protein [Rhodovarius sp.]|nr:O-antigen ligase family protein [Rhodovarius sp.]MCX7931012.1 O-antigen ligase family protein [Rhodovarius sp.]MDW8315349.1 O-antigen ligase family protein [Rhodovarius sp.]